MDCKKLLLNKKPVKIVVDNYKYHIGFIGNCQTVSLNFFLENCLSKEYITKWCRYNDKISFFQTFKSTHKLGILKYGVAYLKNCEVIIYQHIKASTSPLFNTEAIKKYKKPNTILISMPSIFFYYNDYDASLLKLQEQEKNLLNIGDDHVITVSDIINDNKDKNLLLTHNHPNTFFFLEILKKICLILNIPYLSKDKYDYFMKDNNFMKL